MDGTQRPYPVFARQTNLISGYPLMATDWIEARRHASLKVLLGRTEFPSLRRNVPFAGGRIRTNATKPLPGSLALDLNYWKRHSNEPSCYEGQETFRFDWCCLIDTDSVVRGVNVTKICGHWCGI